MTGYPKPVGYPPDLLRLVGRAPEVPVDNPLSQGFHLSHRNPCPTNRSHLFHRCLTGIFTKVDLITSGPQPGTDRS
jgi:hypothetical protein